MTHPPPTTRPPALAVYRSRPMRLLKDRIFSGVGVVAAAASTIVLVTLLTSVLTQALGLMYGSSQMFKHVAFGAMLLMGCAGVATACLTVPRIIRTGFNTRHAIALGVGLLATVVAGIVLDRLIDTGEGVNFLTTQFVTGTPSRNPQDAGIWPAMLGTLWVCVICGLFAIPVGVATAILIEEFKPRNRVATRIHTFIQLNITNLAGVPSIVYGILGLTALSNMFGIIEQRQDRPPAAIGVSYFDRFETEGKRLVYVPVESGEAPPAAITDATEYQDDEGNLVMLERVTPEAMDPRRHKIDDDVESFSNQLKDAVAAMSDPTSGAIAEAAGMILPTTQLRITSAATTKIVTERLAGVDLSASRARSRAIRRIVDDVETTESRERFSGLIRTDAYAARESRKGWWYLQAPFGRSVLAGGLTLALVILPVVIIASQESLRAVPGSMRQASLALGATPWQTVWHTSLPAAVPGIMTGIILAMSRAIGEAAPILIIAGIVYITFTPQHLMDQFTVMPLQIFEWARRPQAEFYQLAAAGIILLLSILLCFNAIAVFIRHKTQRPLS